MLADKDDYESRHPSEHMESPTESPEQKKKRLGLRERYEQSVWKTESKKNKPSLRELLKRAKEIRRENAEAKEAWKAKETVMEIKPHFLIDVPFLSVKAKVPTPIKDIVLEQKKSPVAEEPKKPDINAVMIEAMDKGRESGAIKRALKNEKRLRDLDDE